MCVYAYEFICMCMLVCVCIYIYIYTHTHTHMYIYKCVRSCACVRLSVSACLCVWTENNVISRRLWKISLKKETSETSSFCWRLLRYSQFYRSLIERYMITWIFICLFLNTGFRLRTPRVTLTRWILTGRCKVNKTKIKK